MKEKTAIINKIDNIKDQLIELGNEIHKNPELSFHEYNAARNIITMLEKHGFTIKKGIGVLETSFRAEYDGKGNGPTVAFLAEHDALPEIGHGCGHNLIATMAVGAAIWLKEVSNYTNGKIVVLGTPAEEGGGGKIIMLEEGCFDDIDYASCQFSIRAETIKDLKIVVQYVEHIVNTIEELIGVNGHIEKSLIYAERYPNRYIDERLKDNISRFGVDMKYPDSNMKYGSSDIGNVSLKVPSIHSYIKIANKEVNSHSINFTEAANTSMAYEQIIKAVKAMALTAFDIFTDETLRKNIYDEFNRTVPKYDKNDLK